MHKTYLLILLFATNLCLFAQTGATSPEFEAQAIGGKEQIEQVFQTQLSLPKTLLTNNFDRDVTVFFELDSAGYASDVKFDKGLNNLLRYEMNRMFRFLKFRKTLHLPNESRPYFFTFHFSAEKYNKYYKQKSKLNLKKNLPADSSYVIYTKADKSPEYYKNGDEGLAEFVLSEIEYPKLAIEKSIEGTVVIDFVVETNGYVTTLEVKKSVNASCTEEALRIIKQSKWQPAVLNNKLVRYKTSYPITFSLRNVNKDSSSSQTIGQ